MSTCGNPDVETEALMPRKTKFDKSKVCIKCKAELGNIVIRHAVYCKGCFSPLVITKFRRCLDPHINAAPDGPRRTHLKASGNLLIGLSGGLASTVLLDILSCCYFPSFGRLQDSVKGGKDHPRKDPVWKKVTVCYVEVSGAFPEGHMKDCTEEVRKVVTRYNAFEFVTLRLEDAFDESWWGKANGATLPVDTRVNLANQALNVCDVAPTSLDPVAALQSHLSALPTPTAVRSSIATLTRLLLLHTAWSTESSHLALGTSLTSLSISLINSIAQGGGFNLKEESFEEWRHDPEKATDKDDALENNNRTVRIVRPLRDIGTKECAAWAWWNDLHIVGREEIPDMSRRLTIDGLTKDFIVGLERDYPSTVSAIARTCAKLAPKNDSESRCVLCERWCQRGVQDWKASISIRSYGHSSTRIIEDACPPPLSRSLTSHLCYACHTTLTSRSSRSMQQSGSTDGLLVPLPVWTRSTLGTEKQLGEDILETKQLKHEDMKRTVEEFILDD